MDMSKTHEVAAFGEINNPETSRIRIEPGQPFQCPCGTEQSTNNGWLAAHWTVECVSECKDCGQKFRMQYGIVKLVGNGRWKE